MKKPQLTIGDKKMLDDEVARMRKFAGNVIDRMSQDVPRVSPVKNSQTATGDYYDGKFETIDYLEYMMVKLLENNMAPERAYDVVCALKYLSPRLGAKADQPVQLDLMKAENYIHRARTGKWLDKEFLDPFSK
jgi:hypothetical protein